MQWSLFICDSFYSFYVSWNQTVSSLFWDTRSGLFYSKLSWLKNLVTALETVIQLSFEGFQKLSGVRGGYSPPPLPLVSTTH